jgi:hypothetical protein
LSEPSSDSFADAARVDLRELLLGDDALLERCVDVLDDALELLFD